MRKKTYQTKSRKLILEYLKEQKDHTVTISDIVDFLQEKGETINISTVYRYLDKLAEEQIVMKYPKEDGKKAAFQYVEKEHVCHQHLHMQCVKCGSLIHLNCAFMEEIRKHMKQHHKFNLQCQHSMLYGICETCEEIQKTGDGEA